MVIVALSPGRHIVQALRQSPSAGLHISQPGGKCLRKGDARALRAADRRGPATDRGGLSAAAIAAGPSVVGRRVGRLLGQKSRAAGLFQVEVKVTDGRAFLHWQKAERWREWAVLSEGCYPLRTNVTDPCDEELWKTYIRLTKAAYRIHKSDLSIRPIWHQREERVLAGGPSPAHLFVPHPAIQIPFHRAVPGDMQFTGRIRFPRIQVLDLTSNGLS